MATGSLDFIVVGPMFSGKSNYMIMFLKQLMLAGGNCLIVKYKDDDRYDAERLVSHDKINLGIPASNSSAYTYQHKLFEIPEQSIHNADLIAIDEAQLFPDLYDFVVDAIERKSKRVVLAGLDSWHNFVPCHSVLNLIPYAKTVIKKTAVCTRCRSQHAVCTYKRASGNAAASLICIGGSDQYESMCLACYRQATSKLI